MAIREKLQEQFGILSKEKERRAKLKSNGEIASADLENIIGGNTEVAKNPEFRQQVEEKAKQAMGVDSSELSEDQLGHFIGGNTEMYKDEEFRQQMIDDAMRTMNGDTPTRG